MTAGELIALAALVLGQAGVIVAYLVRIESRLSRIEGVLDTSPRTRVVDFRQPPNKSRGFG